MPEKVEEKANNLFHNSWLGFIHQRLMVPVFILNSGLWWVTFGSLKTDCIPHNGGHHS